MEVDKLTIRIRLRFTILYLLPAIIVVVIFYIYPIVFTVPVSLMKWDGITSMKYIGVDNFRLLFGASEFRTALLNTALWIVVALCLHIPLGLVLALILKRKPRGWKFFRTIYFLPNILSTASLALLWYFLLNPTIGPVNALLKYFGFDHLARPWLSQPGTALFVNQIPFIIYVGFTMLIFLAQITVIPKEFYEAAEIDGANVFYQDLYITIPLIRRAFLINVLFNLSFCLKMIEYPLNMTSGGPGNATLTLPLFMYYSMTRARQYGITMASGLITIVFGALFMLVVFGASKIAQRRWA